MSMNGNDKLRAQHDFIQAQALAADVWESMPQKERNRLKSIAGRKGTEKAWRSASEIAYAIQIKAAQIEAKCFLNVTGSTDAAARRYLDLCQMAIPIEFFVR